MRPVLFPAIAAFSLLAIPAFAQSNNSASNANAGTNDASASAPPSAQATLSIEHNLRQELAKAGYTDIKIFPGSFMVHAKDSHGYPTEMMVSPNSLTQITAMNNPGNAGHSGTNGGSQNGSAGTTQQ